MTVAEGRKCPNGHEVRAGVEFCTKCGASLESDPSAAVAAHERPMRRLLSLGIALVAAILIGAGGFALGNDRQASDQSEPPATTTTSAATSTTERRSTTTTTVTTTSPTPATNTTEQVGPASDAILPPATVPPVGSVCAIPTSPYGAVGTPGPIDCGGGRGVNRLAWEFFASEFPYFFVLGPAPTSDDMWNAHCTAIKDDLWTGSVEGTVVQMATEYYGWPKSLGDELSDRWWIQGEECP